MRILILGGTGFLGRHLTNSSMSAGHAVTLFNRGKLHKNLFPDVETILGDRRNDIHLLDREWDAVIDTCGYLPRVVRISLDHLASRVGRYALVSSISVYDRSLPAAIDLAGFR